MCTGDNLDTATAISKNAGIVTQEQIDANPLWSRMEGKVFRELVGGLKRYPDPSSKETDPKKVKMIEHLGNQNKFNQVIKHLRVLARSSPEDKYLLVTGVQASPFYKEEQDIESGKSLNPKDIDPTKPE
jgi:Ca2+ transporting ATPase